MTDPISVNIPHDLGAVEAKRRIATGFSKMVGQVPGGNMMKLNESWDGDRMKFDARALGQTVSGYVDVGATSVTLVMVLPPLLAGIADKLRGKLSQAGQLLLKKG